MGRKGQIYILPTGFGLTFITGALIMILIGATYQNNLVNLLAFFMLSLVFVAMVQTHNNLKDVQVQSVEADNGFAGSDFVVTFTLKNTSKVPRFNLEAGLRKLRLLHAYENLHPLSANSSIKLRSSFEASARGRYQIKDTKIFSVFPLGLFRAWMWLECDATYYVYPARHGTLALPVSHQSEIDSTTLPVAGGDDFHEHRKYQSGDSMGHIDWKARARGRPLLVKEFNEGSLESVVLDHRQLDFTDPEAALSQMAQWVELAVVRQVPFGMMLPGLEIAIGSGHVHARKCLEALAVFQGRSS